MAKRRHLREADLLKIIERKGLFVINPLAWRNQGKLKRLEGLVKQGKLKSYRPRLDYMEYSKP